MLRHDTRLGGNGLADDRLGGVEISLQEHRGNGQDVPDIVETLTGIVGGELLERVEFDPGQISNGVSVFDAVEPPDRHPARVGVGGIERKGLHLDPGHQLLHLVGGHPGLVGRRHDARAHILHDPPPEGVIPDLVIGSEIIQVDVALGRPAPVAIVAILVQDGLDLPVE